MNAVKTNLKRLRTARKMTQDELAEKLHVVRQTVSSWETGKTTPDVETLTAIAQALEVDISELIYGRQPESLPSVQRAKRMRTAVFWAVGAMACGVLVSSWGNILRSFGVTNAFDPGNFTIDPYRWSLIWFGSAFLPCMTCIFTGIALVSVVRIKKTWFVRRIWLRRMLLLLGLSLPTYHFGMSTIAFLQMLGLFPALPEFLSSHVNNYFFHFFFYHQYVLLPFGFLIALGFPE